MRVCGLQDLRERVVTLTSETEGEEGGCILEVLARLGPARLDGYACWQSLRELNGRPEGRQNTVRFPQSPDRHRFLLLHASYDLHGWHGFGVQSNARPVLASLGRYLACKAACVRLALRSNPSARSSR
eukprot:3023084-Pleurochrysis_carterae.AAC.1